MTNLDFFKNGVHLSFLTDDNGLIRQSSFGAKKTDNPDALFVPTEVFASGEDIDAHHGAKHLGSVLSRLFYESHTETENEISVTMKNDKLRVTQHYLFFNGVSAVRGFSEVTNISDEPVGLEYVSSLSVYGFSMDKIFLCPNSWAQELSWQEFSPEQLGLNGFRDQTTSRAVISNTGTWSSKEYMPMGMIKNSDGFMFWQIESSASWNFEISEAPDFNYLRLSGPSEQENMWYKSLTPGETFKTVTAAICFAPDFDGAVFAMTKYRRNIAYKTPADSLLPVIFNDYMNCLYANPTTEKEFPVIDAASRYGADIFCMDAGWYANGSWWDTVGEWKVFPDRFPGGMKKVFDFIKEKNMKPGIWLEPEVMGVNCPILDQFTDDCFFMRHGKKVIDHGRYQFDFRNKKVTDFLTGVVDSLIENYGIEFFKFDYNIDAGSGTEVDSDSCGDGLMRHREAYFAWIDSLYEKHPGLIIENCASGGLRMDYSSLAHFPLQSVTDASSLPLTAVIASASGTAVIPEQAEVWIAPKADSGEDEVAFFMANSLFRRPVLSGETYLFTDKRAELVKEAVSLYKSLRSEIPSLVPFYPAGVPHFGDKTVVSGFSGETCDYVTVGNLSAAGAIKIPLGEKYKSAECIYPSSFEGNIELNSDGLTVQLRENSAAVIKLTK